jgi:hypothetical protein
VGIFGLSTLTFPIVAESKPYSLKFLKAWGTRRRFFFGVSERNHGGGEASQAAEKVVYFVIPSEARNLFDLTP